MSAADTVRELDGFPGRVAGSDAERRAAGWLAREVDGSGRRARAETFWCRPNWALAHAWHVALAIAGSVTMVSSAAVGGILALLALGCVALDAFTGRSPGRRLTPEVASQNVRAVPEREADPAPAARLLVTAGYDVGRSGWPYAAPLRRLARAGARLTRGGPWGWLGWLAAAIAWLLVLAVLRATGTTAPATAAVLQIPPTLGLLLALAGLLQQGFAPVGPGAGDPGAAAAVAIALVRALDAAPPRHLSVELLLQGASDGSRHGLLAHLRRHRRSLRAGATIVLGVGAAGSGRPSRWRSDGPFVPVRVRGRLRRLAAALPATGPGALLPHRGRGTGPAHPAALAGLPAMSIGCLDERGGAAHSHRLGDVPATVDTAAMDALLAAALAFVDALDADLGSAPGGE